MKRVMLGIILVLLLSIGGCGSEVKEPAAPEVPTAPPIEAENAAKLFAQHWQNKDWYALYDLLIPELQAAKAKGGFYETMSYFEASDGLEVVFDRVSMSNGKAYAYFNVTRTSLFEGAVPPFEMRYAESIRRFEEGEWKVDAFSNYFNVSLEDTKKDNLEKNCISTLNSVLKDAEDTFLSLSSTFKLYDSEWSKAYCNDFKAAAINIEKMYLKVTGLKCPVEFDRAHSDVISAVKPLNEAVDLMNKDCGGSPLAAENAMDTAEVKISTAKMGLPPEN